LRKLYESIKTAHKEGTKQMTKAKHIRFKTQSVMYKPVYNNPEHERLAKQAKRILTDYSKALIARIIKGSGTPQEKQKLFYSDYKRQALVMNVVNIESKCISPQLVIHTGD
jgi:hypothetical protein